MAKDKIVLASNNKNKIAEIKAMLADYDILTMEEVGFTEDIVEDGTTFLENSLIKAQAIHNFLNEKGIKANVMADDSGLCVNALNGEPGIYSARYSGDHDYAKNRQKLLKNLENAKDRSAYYVTTIVFMKPDGSYKHYEGRVNGEILTAGRGDNGFGYNKLFYCPEIGKTFGEATMEEANTVSHRSRAVNKLKHDLEMKL